MIKTTLLAAFAVLALSGTVQAKEFKDMNHDECFKAGGIEGVSGSGHFSGATFFRCYAPNSEERLINPGMPTQNPPNIGPGGTTVVTPVSTPSSPSSDYYSR